MSSAMSIVVDIVAVAGVTAGAHVQGSKSVTAWERHGALHVEIASCIDAGADACVFARTTQRVTGNAFGVAFYTRPVLPTECACVCACVRAHIRLNVAGWHYAWRGWHRRTQHSGGWRRRTQHSVVGTDALNTAAHGDSSYYIPSSGASVLARRVAMDGGCHTVDLRVFPCVVGALGVDSTGTPAWTAAGVFAFTVALIFVKAVAGHVWPRRVAQDRAEFSNCVRCFTIIFLFLAAPCRVCCPFAQRNGGGRWHRGRARCGEC